MHQVSFRAFLLVFLIAVLIFNGWAYGYGYLTIQRDEYKCYGGNRLYPAGDKVQFMKLGSLHWLYQPYAWGCPDERRYDPDKFKAKNGILVPNVP